MGSYVCQEAIFRHPNIALAFVSIGATCITLSQNLREQFRLRIGTWLSGLYPYELLKKPTARMVSNTPQGKTYVLDALNLIDAQEYLHIMRAVGRGFHAEVNYKIHCSLLLMQGDRDYAAQQKQLEQWAARDQAQPPITIPNAGHIANYDNPAFFNQTLQEFLVQHLPESAF